MFNYNRNEIKILDLFKNKEKYKLTVAIPFFNIENVTKRNILIYLVSVDDLIGLILLPLFLGKISHRNMS